MLVARCAPIPFSFPYGGKGAGKFLRFKLVKKDTIGDLNVSQV
jgi:hypothetical protein